MIEQKALPSFYFYLQYQYCMCQQMLLLLSLSLSPTRCLPLPSNSFHPTQPLRSFLLPFRQVCQLLKLAQLTTSTYVVQILVILCLAEDLYLIISSLVTWTNDV